MKILFIYPNIEGYGRIPLAVAILSACLKQHRHQVELFDLTFKVSRNLDNTMRERIGIAKPVDAEQYWGDSRGVNYMAEFKQVLKDFNPDMVCITLIQNNYWAGCDLLKEARRISRAYIIAGGTFASVMPQVLLKDKLVDAVVVGEGEEALIELVNAVRDKLPITDIQNIAYLKDDEVLTNPIRRYVDLNKLPFQDLSIFDQRHFAKPFNGQMVRAGYFELTRGCPYSCTYCANYFLNKTLYEHEKQHIRFKNVERCVEEIAFLTQKYQFDFVFFADENLLVLPFEELQKLAALWKKYINLPFYVTTRVEAATEEKIKLLKEMGCATVAFGIECGNEKFRREVLERFNTNEQIIQAFKLCRKYGIRTTANNMFGFPYEAKEHIFDTIRLNIAAKPDSFSLSIFAPYVGTKLYQICRQEGYLKEEIPLRISMIDESILDMPQISKETIQSLYFDFVKYFNGELKLPEFEKKS